MMTLIPLVGILGDLYKIPIATKNTLCWIINRGYEEYLDP